MIQIIASDIRQGVLELFEIRPRMPIIDWAVANIDFSQMPSAPLERFEPMCSPYLIEPLRAWEFDGVKREMTLCGPEQGGKTLLQSIGVLYHLVSTGGNFLICYPSDDDAELMNETKYEPLIKLIPQLAADLSLPRARSADHYSFASTGSKLHFQGAGVAAMGGTYTIVVSDECDKYPKVKNLNNIFELRKRTRWPKSSMFCKVCTPIEKHGKIWTEFLSGSRGYYTLHCMGCGNHTMRSCDFNNLQFKTEWDDELRLHVLVPGSIRLICPHCGHEHIESDRVAISQQGKYIHERPERVFKTPSFQFGALAVLADSCSWEEIAKVILESGKSADIEAHYHLDNGWKGLPYDQEKHKVNKSEADALKDHFWGVLPPVEEIEAIFTISDTQDAFSPTAAFALDIRDNLYMIDYRDIDFLMLPENELRQINIERAAAKIEPADTLERFINGEMLVNGDSGGLVPLFHVIDAKGHRTPEVKLFSSRNKKVLIWNGAQLKYDAWRQTSAETPRSYTIDARTYQAKLIRALYYSTEKTSGYFFLSPNLSAKTLDEIASYKPDTAKRSGHMPENWDCGDAVHDAFDVCKMALWAVEMARTKFPRKFYRLGLAPSFQRMQELANRKTEAKNKKTVRAKSSWLNMGG